MECSLSSSQGLEDSLRGLIFTVNLTRFGISWGIYSWKCLWVCFQRGNWTRKSPPPLESGQCLLMDLSCWLNEKGRKEKTHSAMAFQLSVLCDVAITWSVTQELCHHAFSTTMLKHWAKLNPYFCKLPFPKWFGHRNGKKYLIQCPKTVLETQASGYWPSVGLINMGKHRQGPRSEAELHHRSGMLWLMTSRPLWHEEGIDRQIRGVVLCCFPRD